MPRTKKRNHARWMPSRFWKLQCTDNMDNINLLQTEKKTWINRVKIWIMFDRHFVHVTSIPHTMSSPQQLLTINQKFIIFTWIFQHQTTNHQSIAMSDWKIMTSCPVFLNTAPLLDGFSNTRERKWLLNLLVFVSGCLYYISHNAS